MLLPSVKIFRPVNPVRATVVPGFAEVNSIIYAKQSTRLLFSVGRFRFGLFRPTSLKPDLRVNYERKGWVARELSTGACAVSEHGFSDPEKALAVAINRVLRGSPQLDRVVSEWSARFPTLEPLNQLPERAWSNFTEHNFSDPKEAYNIGPMHWRYAQHVAPVEKAPAFDPVTFKGKTYDAPAFETVRAWQFDGVCDALDDCRVEPDGHCPHGFPSWLLALGL